MEKEKYYILSCSFGKDSLYLLHFILENSMPLDEVQFVEPMFDKNISGLLPKHKEFINYVISKFPNVYFNIIKSEKTYKEMYLKYGCPQFRRCHWCTSALKTEPLRKNKKSLKTNYNIYYYIGLCANEKERVLKNKNKNNIYPLFDNNIDEKICFEWCKNNNLLSPIYTNSVFRDGCWFCPFQSKLQWNLLKLNEPKLFNLMVQLEYERFIHNPQYSLVRSKPLNIYINGIIQMSIYDYGDFNE